MKRTHQAVISIISLMLILSFTSSAFAQDVCIIKWWGDDSGWAPTSETSRTEEAVLQAFDLFIGYNYDNYEWSYYQWIPNCYEGTKAEGELFLGGRVIWSKGSVCISGFWRAFVEDGNYGYPGDIIFDSSGNWDVICGPDADGDTLPDSEDNDTVYGTVSGVVQEGVTVGIYRPNCGGDILLDTTTTNSEGYYAFGNLSNGWHTIVPELEGYTFLPETDYPKIPQTEIKSYDFTATVD